LTFLSDPPGHGYGYLCNAEIDFGINHSKLQLWADIEQPQDDKDRQKIPTSRRFEVKCDFATDSCRTLGYLNSWGRYHASQARRNHFHLKLLKQAWGGAISDFQ
jgi:hypothetical protein